MATIPFLKWAGSRRSLARRSAGRTVEPFVESGAAFFASWPKDAILSDTNYELIATFRPVRESRRQIQILLTMGSY
jgi:DNA adenine methylase